MIGLIALIIFGLWLLWTSYYDNKERTSVSSSTWIVVVWVVIHGTRPLTSWLGLEGQYSRDEGNPEEAFVNIVLIAAGVFVLLQRGIQWSAVVADNRWLSVFYLFWFMSILWSDYPVITFKRLFKDLGYIIMVFLVLTDREPNESIKAVCVRVAYVCIPLSILLIRYYPGWGRILVGYQSNIPMYVGVTMHKNILGALVLVSALFLLWDLLASRDKYRDRTSNITFVSRIVVLLMCWHLLLTIDSQTSLICALLGTGLLILFFGFPLVQYNPRRIEGLGLSLAAILLIVDSFIDLKAALLESVNRDPTLTTRADIWPILIEFQDSALVGQGFNTFWAGERMKQLADTTFGIIQAHNGYIETYLNGGIIGVGLLVCVLLSAYVRIRRKLALNLPDGSIRLVILLTAVLHNYSEASFNKIGSLWFVTLFSITEYRSGLRRV